MTLAYDNGQGLEFRRTISVDDKYLFTVKEDVVNKSGNPVTLFPYGLISRHGTPETAGYYILHEGLIGYLGDKACRNTPTRRSSTRRSRSTSTSPTAGSASPTSTGPPPCCPTRRRT